MSTSLAHRLRHALSDVFALGYLVVCAGLMIWVLVVTVTDDSGESMAGVIPALATAPFSLVMLALPESTLGIVASVVFGALVNATVIGLCARALRRGNRPDPA
ncbi:SCO4225 family membrane protein [Streptomyces niveus]|uniref:SCO4225 family membrane protein n=1 Tax=Streptomyces niveus TaxID=193462 RepID=UPI00362FD336